MGSWEKLEGDTYDGMFSLVPFSLKVQVVLEWVVLSSLSDGCAVDCDIEFTPSLFAYFEWRLAEGYCSL
jgi:hypothetical protein